MSLGAIDLDRSLSVESGGAGGGPVGAPEALVLLPKKEKFVNGGRGASEGEDGGKERGWRGGGSRRAPGLRRWACRLG